MAVLSPHALQPCGEFLTVRKKKWLIKNLIVMVLEGTGVQRCTEVLFFSSFSSELWIYYTVSLEGTLLSLLKGHGRGPLRNYDI